MVEYMHDIMDRVTNISWRTTRGAAIGGFEYEYDAAGRIVSRSHAIGSNAFDRVYAYDGLDRLASDGDVTYTYDAAGNRMTRTEDGETVTYTLGVGDRLASWTGGSYTYDFAGNVTRIERDGRPTLFLTWNSRYQLDTVYTNGVFAEGYEYDALGRRVATANMEGTTRHVYDDNWQVVADIDANGNVIASYIWGDGIDNLLAVKVGGASYYPLTDIRGTVWGYIDSQNNVVARWQYDAWGNVVDESVSVPALASLRYRFQCREWSAATGLVHFRMRWYDPENGRWLSKDPIGLCGGSNLYVVCKNDLIANTDRYGLYPDARSYVETKEGKCLDGNKIVSDIRKFYDGIDEASRMYWWVPKGATSYIALFSLSGGPWGPCDFKINDSGYRVYYRGEYYGADEFGNYIAGYQAGYSGVKGLLLGVKIGGWLWSAVPGGEPIGDGESVPMINRGYNDGVRKRKMQGRK